MIIFTMFFITQQVTKNCENTQFKSEVQNGDSKEKKSTTYYFNNK